MLNNEKSQLNELEDNQLLREQKLNDELELRKINELNREISFIENQEQKLHHQEKISQDEVNEIKEIEFIYVDEEYKHIPKHRSIETTTPIFSSSNVDEKSRSIKDLSKEVALKEKEKEKAAKSQYKNLSKDEKAKIKARIKEIKKMNSPHKGPTDIEFKNKDNIIELTDVRKYYSNGFLVTEILKGVDLEIKNGDFVIILGPSGSGKTTLMNIISGLDRASSGVVNVAGKNLICFNDSELTKFRRDNVGYVFQQYGLLPNLTVKENIEIGQQLQSDKSKRKPIEDIVKSVGLLDHINKFPHQLSGGQQQRVSIARAFAKNPTILFGDEPTGAIDEEMSKMVLKEFVNINKEYKTTIIIVTHNPIFADLGSLVIKIKDGNIHQCIRNEYPKSVDELP